MHILYPSSELFPQLSDPLNLQTMASRKTIFLLTLCVLAVAFYFIEHSNTEISQRATYQSTTDELTERATQGDARRRLGCSILALFGALMMLRRKGKAITFSSALGWLLLAGFCWSAASILWSEDSSVALRRFTVLMFCSVGALGIARQLTTPELCKIVLLITTVFVAYGVFIEVTLGTFRPFSPDYRFAGTLHPNAQAANCAMMAMIAGFLASRSSQGRMLLWMLCLSGVCLLWATKSRSACVALIIGIVLYNALNASWAKRILMAVTALWVSSTVLLLITLSGRDIGQDFVDAVLIGRHDEAESLSGRIPLWIDLLHYVKDRPFAGHGYMSFWNSARVGKFSQEYRWAVTDGHSAYLDMMLDLGLIGAGVCILTLFIGMREVTCHYRATKNIYYAFFFTLMVSRAIHGFFESAMAAPTSFVSFIIICGFAHLGFCQTVSAPLLSTNALEKSIP